MAAWQKTATVMDVAKTRRSRDIIVPHKKMPDPRESPDGFETEQPRLDRSVVRVFSSHAEADAADKAYWLSRTPHERLRHMEILRRMNYGPRAIARLQRILEFASRESS